MGWPEDSITSDFTVTGNTTLDAKLAVDVNTFYVDAINNRVGVGTTAPQNALNVIGSINSTIGFIVNSSTGLTGNYSVGTCWFAYKGGIVSGTNCTAYA